MGKRIKIANRSSLPDFRFSSHRFEEISFSQNAKSLPGGGRVSIRCQSPEIAASILRRYRSQIAFWQVARQYTIGNKRGNKTHTTGFSKPHKKNENSAHSVIKALDESAINAANQAGYNFKYEGQSPSFVKPSTKNAITLLIWFNNESSQTFLGE